MKKTLLTTLFLSCAFAAYPQGQVNFNNRVTTAGSGAFTPITSLIYGMNSAFPLRELHGQATTGVPAGAIDYVGQGHAALSGTGFTAQLWGGPGGSAEGQLQLCVNGTTSFRTGGGAGIINALVSDVPNAPAGAGSRATLQLRAWDNQNGTITTWAQVLANPLIPRGASDIFTPGFDLGGGPTLPPNLIGLQSFNLHQNVPEPSVIALGALGLGALVLRRFRRS